ncbi:acyltransferase family protein [Aliarcobacter cryaerophilus]|uniref:acyltransferase family protein n=1 Tax=Aliarcobacter cryaerophilus TaxID=28198 RepID=UPI003DA6BF56
MIKMNYIQSISLDMLRVFAVQLVLIGHALSYFGLIQLNGVIQNTAVVLFFILSGTVISYSTFYKKHIDDNYSFKEYFIDRFSRIFTALFPSLIFILVIDLIQIYYVENKNYGYFNALDLKTFIGNLFMLQDYPIFHISNKVFDTDIFLTSFGSGRPLWTLAIEWWLYMAFGLIFFYFIKQFSIKHIPLLLIFLVVPLYNSFYGRGDSLTLFWMGGLIITIMIFKYSIVASKALSIFFMLILPLLILLRLYIKHQAYDLVYVTLIIFFIYFYLSFFSTINYTSEKLKKIIHFFASYAFTLYLIHYSILDFMYFFLDKNNAIKLFIISIIVSNFLAFVLAYFTEIKYKKVRIFMIKLLINKENKNAKR